MAKLKRGLRYVSLVTVYVHDPSLSHHGVFCLSHLTCFSLLVNMEKFIQALDEFVSVLSIFLSHL